MENNIKMCDVAGWHARFADQFTDAFKKIVAEGKYILGPEVESFEQQLAQMLGGVGVCGVANGTDALQLTLDALNVPAGTWVVVPAFGFVSAAEAAIKRGLRPVFIDVEPDTFNMNVNQVQSLNLPQGSVLVPIHLFGHSVNMEPLLIFAKQNNHYTIEDNAQNILGRYSFSAGKSAFCGTMGDFGTLSFFPTKNLGALGDGGAVLSANKQLLDTVRQLSRHGQSQRYIYSESGYNSRLDTLQAAFLNIQLNKLQVAIELRREAARLYIEHLQDCEQVLLPQTKTYTEHTFHQFVIKVPANHRNRLIDFLKENHIPTMVYYPSPLPYQPAFEHLNYKVGNFPIAEELSSKVVALPMHPLLTESQIEYICDKIKLFFKC